MHLTLLAVNVWSGLDYRGLLRVGDMESRASREDRYRALVEQVAAIAPDVLAVNEANPLPGYARRLAADLGYDEVHHPGLSGLRLGPLRLPTNLVEGDAILARRGLGLTWVGRGALTGGHVARHCSVNFSNATQVVAARVTVEGRPLYVLCTHWSIATTADEYRQQEGLLQRADATPFERARRARQREAERTLAHARRWVPEGAAAVLMGDLNAGPDAAELGLLRDEGWVDAWLHLHPDAPGSTWDQGRNERIRGRHATAEAVAERVDYVLVNRVLGAACLRSAQVVLDRSPHPSDHFGVAVSIEVAA